MTTSNNGFGIIKSEDVALILGRIAIAVFVLPSGRSKVLHFNRFALGLAANGLPFGIALPFPYVFAAAAVAIEVAGPLLILIGLRTKWVALLMVAFVAMASLTTHRYWEMEGQLRQINSTNFYKNLAIMGGLLFLYASEAGFFSLDSFKKRRDDLLLSAAAQRATKE